MLQIVNYLYYRLFITYVADSLITNIIDCSIHMLQIVNYIYYRLFITYVADC